MLHSNCWIKIGAVNIAYGSDIIGPILHTYRPSTNRRSAIVYQTSAGVCYQAYASKVSTLIAGMKSISAAARPYTAIHSLSSFPYYGNKQRQERNNLGLSLDKTSSGKDSLTATQDLHDSKLLNAHVHVFVTTSSYYKHTHKDKNKVVLHHQSTERFILSNTLFVATRSGWGTWSVTINNLGP